MATVLEVWQRLNELIREQTTGATGLKLLFEDRQANQESSSKMKRGDKYIIGAIDIYSARNLQTAINDFLRDDHNKITDKKTQKPKEYRLNVKIVKDSSPDVYLMTYRACSTMVYSYKDIMEYLEKQAKKGAHANEYQKAVQKLAMHYLLTLDEDYYVTKIGGESYKVRFFDNTKTNHISVGDVLIIVGADTLEKWRKNYEIFGTERADKIKKKSADVIASAENVFIRKLPEEKKEQLKLDKGKA